MGPVNADILRISVHVKASKFRKNLGLRDQTLSNERETAINT